MNLRGRASKRREPHGKGALEICVEVVLRFRLSCMRAGKGSMRTGGLKTLGLWGAWLSVQHVTLGLGVVSSSSMLDVEPT